MKKITFIMLIVVVAVFSVSAQNFAEGQILNDTKPVKGIVIETSANQKTKTNKRGYFKIDNVRLDNDTLFIELGAGVFLEIALDNDNYFDINIRNDSVFVERNRFQIVRPAYGGTIVSRRELLQSGDTDLLRAFSNRVVGVQYNGGNLQVRGGYPLYVIDGMRTFNVPRLSIFDVESVELVSGPKGMGMFGVDGFHGVIVISSRKANSPD